jgi:hypothetical protein
MKRLSLAFSVLAVAAPMVAASPEAKPAPTACKANLKEWSQQKTETLTLMQLNEGMNMMFACAELAKKHEKTDANISGRILPNAQ